MDRNTAWHLVQSSVRNQNLAKHMLATEACLRALARHLGQNEEKWGIAGLLHDIDYEQTKDEPARHSLLAADTLTAYGVDPEVVHSVKAHSGNVPLESLLDKAIWATDPVTGLIVAAALMHPSKKLANVNVDFLIHRFQEKRFAAGANRDQIKTCTANLGLELRDFLDICLKAMQEIAPQLGL